MTLPIRDETLRRLGNPVTQNIHGIVMFQLII